jgi:VWFA-related protein
VPARLILIVDDVHLHQASKVRALQAVQRYVEKTMDASTTAMLVRWNGSVETRVKPTSRKDALLAALQAMETEPGLAMHADGDRRTLLRMKAVLDPDEYYQTVLQFCESQRRETEQTMKAIREIIRSLAGMEGRKSVLFISEGIPLLAGYEMLADATGRGGIPLDAMRFDRSRDLRDLGKVAQDAGVVFSTLDPSPTVRPMDDLGLDYKLMRDNARDTVTMLARQTGGQVIFDRNDLDEELLALDEKVSTYYSIGVRPPASAGKDFKVQVNVKNQPRLRVLTSTRRNLPSRDEAIANAVRSQLYLREEQNPLDARVEISHVDRQRDRCVASLAVQVPSANLALLPNTNPRGQIDIRFAVLDDRGQESDVRTMTRNVGDESVVSETLSIGLRERTYVVSAAIVDRLSGTVSYMQRDVDCRK